MYNIVYSMFSQLLYDCNWLCHLATFLHYHYYKGGQVTKPIIVVKTCYKLLYVTQVVKKLISNFLASADIKVFGCTYIYNAASDWPRTFLTPNVFLYTYIYIYVYNIIM